MTATLLGLDTLLTVLAAGAWLGAGVLAVTGQRDRRTNLLVLGLTGLGLVTLLARVAVVLGLAGAGRWFVADKVLGLGLAALPAAALLATRSRRVRAGAVGDPRTAALLLMCGYGSAAGLLLTFAVGYPVTLSAAAVVTLLVVGLATITWVVLVGAPPRQRTATVAGAAGLAVVVLLGSLGAAWWRSRVPDRVSMTDHSAHTAGMVSVADLRGPATPEPGGEIRRFTLTAGRTERGTVAFNGAVPGPEILATQGDLVEVTLANKDIADGVTIHWHGYDVPNGEDGVAGVTQDAVKPGQTFTYRFLANDTGTYWYHSHQQSHAQVRDGLYGTLVVTPREPARGLDLAVPVHTLRGSVLIGAVDGIDRRAVPAGEPVRLRLVNTDNTPHRFALHGVSHRLVAVDGRELNEPGPVERQTLRLAAGGRYDLAFTMPAGPVWLTVDNRRDRGLHLGGAEGDPPPSAAGWPELDLLSYGEPAPTGIETATFTREATMVLDRTIRFLDGRPRLAFTVNGEVFPHIPAITVREGDLLRLTVVTRGGDTHPIHPHGHHVLVLSRNGVAATGSPLWMDTFDVRPGEVWRVALRADNPGVWMSHCHNLDHAANGMTVHLAYEGVGSPYTVGDATGNHPE